MAGELTNFPQMMSVVEVAAALKIGRNLAYRMCREGQLPAVRLGSRYLISRDALVKFVTREVEQK